MCIRDRARTGRSLASSTPLRVSAVSALEDASVSYSSLDGWLEDGRGPGFLSLLETAWRTRAYGDFWSYMLVADGAVDVACEPELALYDMAALVPIVTAVSYTHLDVYKRQPCGGPRRTPSP